MDVWALYGIVGPRYALIPARALPPATRWIIMRP
jgi:hypothetical protein